MNLLLLLLTLTSQNAQPAPVSVCEALEKAIKGEKRVTVFGVVQAGEMSLALRPRPACTPPAMIVRQRWHLGIELLAPLVLDSREPSGGPEDGLRAAAWYRTQPFRRLIVRTVVSGRLETVIEGKTKKNWGYGHSGEFGVRLIVEKVLMSEIEGEKEIVREDAKPQDPD